jgi:hypothetical protein
MDDAVSVAGQRDAFIPIVQAGQERAIQWASLSPTDQVTCEGAEKVMRVEQKARGPKPQKPHGRP